MKKRKEKEFLKNPAKFNFKKPEPFAPKWCEDARNQGYVFIVDIAGYGK